MHQTAGGGVRSAPSRSHRRPSRPPGPVHSVPGTVRRRETVTVLSHHFDNSRYMDDIETIAALAALAQPTRLAAFRLMVAREPAGIPAGELAALLAVPQNTLSGHLAVLVRAGLAHGERHSRSILYRADLDRFRAMTLHLVQDCCAGRPEICVPIIRGLTPPCSPKVDVS